MDDVPAPVTNNNVHHRRNGRLMILVLSVLFSIAAGAYGVAWRMNTSQGISLSQHTEKFGHTGMEERMRNVENDVGEIKKDVKELLKR